MVLSNFYRALWYIPHSERESVKPSSFLLQSPPYKLYTQIGSLLDIEGVIPESTDDLDLRACLKDSINVDNLTDYIQLPIEIQQELFRVIIEFFYPTKSFMDSVEFNLDAVLDDKFSDESWGCATCQKRGLDKQRNCPLLDKDEYHEDTYSITIGDISYSVCPMNNKDHDIISVAFEANRILDGGFLAEPGSYGEQPLLFCILAQKVSDKIKSYEQKAMKALKS
ncbi:MAG: hypothetical protein JHC33_09190 [Ignisphaera sp.]|nr:hypothetical protein [Ignisphaera sp.]